MRRMSKAADRLAEGDLGPALRGDRLGAHANHGQDTYGDRFPGPATKLVGCLHRIESQRFLLSRPCSHPTNIAWSAREDRVANRPHTFILLKDFVPLQAKSSQKAGQLKGYLSS